MLLLMAHPLSLKVGSQTFATQFGRESQTLLVCDDFLADPDAVLDIAARAPFERIGPHYPGLRSPVPGAALAPLIAGLSMRLVEAFALPSPPRLHECYLSLVTVSATDLQPIQRLPHFDGLEREALAVLLYLDPSEIGGTAFYRQRSTAFESVDGSRYTTFEQALAQDIAAHGLPAADYIHGDTAIYERICLVAGRFNRAVAYRGNTLHCADLPPGYTPPDDPRDARLTLNLFLRCTG